MKTKYQKPVMEIIEINVHIAMLQGSADLGVNWDDEEIDAADAD